MSSIFPVVPGNRRLAQTICKLKILLWVNVMRIKKRAIVSRTIAARCISIHLVRNGYRLVRVLGALTEEQHEDEQHEKDGRSTRAPDSVRRGRGDRPERHEQGINGPDHQWRHTAGA